MAERLRLRIDGREFTVEKGTTVAAALARAGVRAPHRSISGEPRAPLCGMGICFECGVSIDGRLHERSCQILCTAGMEVRTDA
jgi:predicted molibdopterin-dependent oxidoreductase YjgC